LKKLIFPSSYDVFLNTSFYIVLIIKSSSGLFLGHINGCEKLFKNNYGKDNSSPITEGEEYDVKIEDMGRDGDGIARIEGFVIFVNGAKLGEEVKIKVNSTRRNFAFADVVE